MFMGYNPVTKIPFRPRFNIPEIFDDALSYEDQILRLAQWVGLFKGELQDFFCNVTSYLNGLGLDAIRDEVNALTEKVDEGFTSLENDIADLKLNDIDIATSLHAAIDNIESINEVIELATQQIGTHTTQINDITNTLSGINTVLNNCVTRITNVENRLDSLEDNPIAIEGLYSEIPVVVFMEGSVSLLGRIYLKYNGNNDIVDGVVTGAPTGFTAIFDISELYIRFTITSGLKLAAGSNGVFRVTINTSDSDGALHSFVCLIPWVVLSRADATEIAEQFNTMQSQIGVLQDESQTLNRTITPVDSSGSSVDFAVITDNGNDLLLPYQVKIESDTRAVTPQYDPVGTVRNLHQWAGRVNSVFAGMSHIRSNNNRPIASFNNVGLTSVSSVLFTYRNAAGSTGSGQIYSLLRDYGIVAGRARKLTQVYQISNAATFENLLAAAVANQQLLYIDLLTNVSQSTNINNEHIILDVYLLRGGTISRYGIALLNIYSTDISQSMLFIEASTALAPFSNTDHLIIEGYII